MKLAGLSLCAGGFLSLSGCGLDFSKGNLRSITDMGGRRVSLPEQVDRVFCTNHIGTVDVFGLAPEKLAGWNFRPAGDNKKYIPDECFALPSLGVWMDAGAVPNAEEIAAQNPDALLCFWTADEVGANMADEVQNQTGLPVVLVDYDARSAPTTFRFLGDLMGGLFPVAHFLYTAGCDSSAGPDGQHAGPGQDKHGHANGHDRRARNGLHRAAYTTAAFFANGVAEAIDERGVQRLVVNGLLLLAERWRREGFRGGARGRPCGLRCSARRVDGGNVDDGVPGKRHELPSSVAVLCGNAGLYPARVFVVRDGHSSLVPLSVPYRAACPACQLRGEPSPTRNALPISSRWVLRCAAAWRTLMHWRAPRASRAIS